MKKYLYKLKVNKYYWPKIYKKKNYTFYNIYIYNKSKFKNWIYLW